MSEDQLPGPVQRRERMPTDPARYYKYIEWMATPAPLREPKTKEGWALANGFENKTTVFNWQKRSDFWPAVEARAKEWAREQTPDVLHALHRKIMRTGNAHEARLWLEWVQEWEAKSSASTKTNVQVNVFGDQEWDKFVAGYFSKKAETEPEQP